MNQTKDSYCVKPNVSKDLLDVFHSGKEIAKVPVMTRKKRKDPLILCRPPEGKYMDYTISQTDTKMDAGTTKIHLVQTRATYVEWPEDVEPPAPPPPVPEKKRKYKCTHGAPPCYKFLDEIREEEIAIKQEQYKCESTLRQAKNAAMNRYKKFGTHEMLINLVGPDWYIELAPKQIAAVDKLKACISLDLKQGTVQNVKENMATLGLVLRPNAKLLKKCIKYSCEDPVEFLLLLYQEIEKTRKDYSINDRLILSAVVHLAMRDTLREMHVRIPSPPPRGKPMNVKPKTKNKKQKYDSPYLIPYTFKPKQRKERGIYRNNFKQYPESIYFSYICDYKKQTEDYSQIINELTDPEEGFIVMPDRPLTQEEDLVLELLRAQESYDKFNISAYPTPPLHRANIPPVCRHGRPQSKDEECIKSEIQNTFVQQVSQLAVLDQIEDTEPATTDITIAVEVKVTSDYNEKSELTQQKIEYYVDIDEALQPSYMQCITHSQKLYETSNNTFLINGISIGKDGKPVYSVGGMVKPRCKVISDDVYCNAINSAKETIMNMKNSFLIDGVHLTQDGYPIYGIGAVFPEDHYDDYIKEAQQKLLYSSTMFLITGVCIDREGNPIYGIQGVQATQICKCEFMMAKQAGEARRAAEMEFTITMEQFNMQETKRLQWEKELQNTLDKMEEECYQNFRRVKSSHDNLVTVKKRDSPCCLCRKVVEDFINLPRCKCERCERDKAEKRKIFIVDGLSVRTGEPIHIITGVAEEPDCTCLQRYQENVEAYFDRRMRHNAMLDLKHMEKKYVISGVTKGPNGEPIYMLSGLIPPKRDCECVERNKREQERIKNMPKPLEPDRRYIIGGIQATPNGNVWIVSGVNPFPDCDCMKMYDGFVDKHSNCMALYEAYVDKMKRVMAEYMEEIEGDAGITDSKLTQTDEKKHSKFYYDEDQPHFVIEVTSGTKVTGMKEVTRDPNILRSMVVEPEPEFIPSIQGTVEFDPHQPQFVLIKEDVMLNDEELQVEDEQEFSLDLEVKKKKRVCICLPGSDGKNWDCTCAEHKKKKKKTPPPPRVYKRYILFKKLPCNYAIQMLTTKQVLSTMAEDGFPIARLPHAYLLPHFKLWWRWRCGIYITQDERVDLYYKFSKKFWGHTSKCNKKVKLPCLPIDREEAKKLTWGQAAFVKKMTSEANNNFYRKVKQSHIMDGREFFPTLCDYDLPTKNFRDCIFAYIPWKEEESFAYYPWHPHEYKDMRNAKVCI